MDVSLEESLPEYDFSEIQKHGTPENLWMIIYNKVYDATKFVSMHPGGAEVLFDCGGVDATEAFEDVGHSKNAFEMLVPFLIGKLSESDAKMYKKPEKKKQKCDTKNKTEVAKRQDPIEGYSVRILAVLALLACVAIICLQKLKWANITS